MNINKCPIFISSSDAYSDLWPAFFSIFKREWPEYDGQIILNTENKNFTFPDLDIICTNANTNSKLKFGEVFKNGINKIKSDHFLLFMIDYFIESKVDTTYLQELYQKFLNSDTEALFLQKLGPVPLHIFQDEDIVQMDIQRSVGIAKESIFSFQVAFWRKECITKYIADWENPWFAEYFGCRRAKIFNPKLWMLSGNQKFPISYSGLGVLHGGGRWLDEAISRIDLNGIPLNLSESRIRRGTFIEPKFPRLSRIPKEITLIPERLKSMRSIWELKKHKR